MLENLDLYLYSVVPKDSPTLWTKPKEVITPQQAQLSLTTEMQLVDMAMQRYKETGRTDYLLTAGCKIGGYPYSLVKYPQFIPMFDLKAAPLQVWKCARQTGKSENLTSSRYIRGRVRSNYNTLMVCPRLEQTRRLSNDKAAPLIRNAIPGFLTAKGGVQRVLERELINGNKIQYSHCYLSADASRGFSANGICYDEAQDIVLSFTDIIDQCMSGSKIYYDKLISGTPKESTGTLSIKFETTSQAAWGTKCPHCSKWSLCSDEIDGATGLFYAELMIGERGPRCLYCSKDLGDAPLRGCYVHKYRDRVGIAEGYHVPQVIHYAHWGSQTKWNVLLEFYRGNPLINKDALPRVTFVNEILGIHMDSEEMLIRPEEIKAASKTYANEEAVAYAKRVEYSRVLMSVDWSGFGDDAANSHTALCLIGERVDNGQIEVIYMERLPKSAGVLEQINVIGKLWTKFNCFALVHDGCGAGMQQELLLVKAGIVPADKIIAMMYVDAPVRKFVCERTSNDQRRGLSLDKTRSLLLLFLMLQRRKVALPEYKSAINCTNDFLSLSRDTRTATSGQGRMRILRKSGKSDDFAHAVNYGCTYLWFRKGEYHTLQQNITVKPIQE
jgi:hypothetical protein